MAAARSKLRLLARTGDCFLLVADRRCWLKRDTKVNFLPIADSALHTAGIVGCRAYFPTTHLEWIVVLGASHPRRRETGPDLESFRCRYAQHRFGKICFEFIEDRFTKTRRNAAYHAFNDTANRIALTANLLN